jgi:AraC-like DNA-binding protein
MPTPEHEHATPHPSTEGWYTNPRLQVLTTSETLGWNHASLFIERQEANPEIVNIPFLEDDVLGFLLEGSARIYARLIDGFSFHQHVGPQSLNLIPHHSEVVTNWDAAWTYGILRLNRSFVGEMAAAIQRGDPARIQFVPTRYFTDPLLYHLGMELINEMQHANPLDLLYAESLITTLTLYLLRHHSTGRIVRELSGSRLTPAQLGMVDEYIHAHMDQKISLADLAACLHVSVPHFERMFRATTQRPPYRYVLELRLERAKFLLERTRLPLAAVARQCGLRHISSATSASLPRALRGARAISSLIVM